MTEIWALWIVILIKQKIKSETEKSTLCTFLVSLCPIESKYIIRIKIHWYCDRMPRNYWFCLQNQKNSLTKFLFSYDFYASIVRLRMKFFWKTKCTEHFEYLKNNQYFVSDQITNFILSDEFKPFLGIYSECLGPEESLAPIKTIISSTPSKIERILIWTSLLELV